jgi:hypothetical protein
VSPVEWHSDTVFEGSSSLRTDKRAEGRRLPCTPLALSQKIFLELVQQYSSIQVADLFDRLLAELVKTVELSKKMRLNTQHGVAQKA